MTSQNNQEKLWKQLEQLQEKYDAMGQDLSSYLEGLLYSNSLNYWDYIHLDTLLSLQNTRTDFPDERIFIVYHQITELYFSLIQDEIKQIAHAKDLKAQEFLMRIKRCNRYLKHLISSFDIMSDGMDREQFMKFRMALLPASGFQSVQYREIEIRSTDLWNLVANEYRHRVDQEAGMLKMYEHLYWRQGANELATGKKTLTLRKFEEKYRDKLIELSEKMVGQNLWSIYKKLEKGMLENELVQAMKEYDVNTNIGWSMAHMRAAARYLQNDVAVISATGGTNWQSYLPPKFQRIIFFPDLWTEEEKAQWGRNFK
ncbi:MAG: tryptophan 2,3-dioxygenase family protein [Flammeovirgaceae bacterium]